MRSAAQRTRELIQRAVTMVAIVAGGALLLNLLAGEREDATATGAAPDERGYYLSEARLTELGEDGNPRVVVRAQSIEQQLPDQSVRLAQLELDYNTARQGQWHVTADRGRMPSDRSTLLLSGNVLVAGSAQRNEGQALIRTDELAYDTRTDVVQTTAPVTVEFGPHQLRGRGMRVSLNQGTLRLESNVNGQFKP
ncbi:MAG: LPS export ABC transporter periplasmic protein LptC [Gammaproteobacteria bacterium]|nr:LPS export ABC transporter periplasmic protein LptC [Gammaproteobacteria bacterium]MDH5176536.1 LPS export ABC transporter periplasmic protein LptC [Gammaproteobacteria bacterium]MDH5227912.1 LPS export ABC transporter periplasmic protein LptC [Gammaproteobacteria bacterium]